MDENIGHVAGDVEISFDLVGENNIKINHVCGDVVINIYGAGIDVDKLKTICLFRHVCGDVNYKYFLKQNQSKKLQ